MADGIGYAAFFYGCCFLSLRVLSYVRSGDGLLGEWVLSGVRTAFIFFLNGYYLLPPKCPPPPPPRCEPPENPPPDERELL